MKKLLVLVSVVVGCLLCVGNTFAESVYTYPEKAPVFSIAFPDDWTVELDQEDQRGMFALSPDEAIELDIWPLNEEEIAEDRAAAVDNAIAEINDVLAEYVTDFQAVKQSQFEINGIKFDNLDGTAKELDDGSDVMISVAFFWPNDETLFVLMYWGTSEGEQIHAEALNAIMQSIKKP